MGRGLANGATGISTERRERHVGRSGSGRAAGRAAWNSCSIERVQDLPECRVLGGASHSELVHVRAPYEKRACFFELMGHGRVIRGRIVRKHLRGRARDMAFDEDVVLHRKRDAAQERGRVPFLIDTLLRVRYRLLVRFEDLEVCIQFRIALNRFSCHRVPQLVYRYLLGAELLPRLDYGKLVQ